MAIAYGQFVCCEHPTENDSCGVCHSCKKYQKLIHPDLHFIFPVNTTKDSEKDVSSDHFLAKWRELFLHSPYFSENRWYEYIGIENKQGSISKNEASEIIRKLSLKSFESEYKVVIIWLPERMNEVSANKLLKLIEEPADKTLFILVSENSERIIKTILSRTQLVKIPHIDRQSLVSALMDKLAVEPFLAQSIARIANGNFALAQQLAADGSQSATWFDAFQQLMKLPLLGQIPLVQGIREGGDSGMPIATKDTISGKAFQLLAEKFLDQIELRNKNLEPTKRVEIKTR